MRAYTRSYTYDKVGNIQELTHVATSNNFTRVYNYATDLNHLEDISTSGGTVNASFVYDDVGNLVQTDTNRHYQSDAADQLVYTKIQASGGPISIQAAYLYDAGGQRVKRYVRDAFGTTFEGTVYIDGIYEHRYNASYHQTMLLVKAGRSQLASLRIGDPLDGSTPPLTYELEDHLGTIVARLDGSGALYDSEEFYPFGEHCLRQFTMKRYGYVGKEYDVETGLLYYGARYYAAWTCRFVSVDPLAGSYPWLTPYNYASQNPIGGIDIDGLQSSNEPAKANPRSQRSYSAPNGGEVTLPRGAVVDETDVHQSNTYLYCDELVSTTMGSLMSFDYQGATYDAQFSGGAFTGYFGTNGLSLTPQGSTLPDPSAEDIFRTNLFTGSAIGAYESYDSKIYSADVSSSGALVLLGAGSKGGGSAAGLAGAEAAAATGVVTAIGVGAGLAIGGGVVWLFTGNGAITAPPIAVPATKTHDRQTPEYIYRNMKREFNGMPVLGNDGVNKLGVRPKDVDFKGPDEIIGASDVLGMSVTYLMPQMTPFATNSTTLYKLPIESLFKHGLMFIPKPDTPFAGLVVPALPMSVAQFQDAVGRTQREWTPYR